LPGTKIFGVRHDQVFFGVSLLKLQIQQILSENRRNYNEKMRSRNFVTHFASLICLPVWVSLSACRACRRQVIPLVLARHGPGPDRAVLRLS
jgi:hypothetical protein